MFRQVPTANHCLVRNETRGVGTLLAETSRSPALMPARSPGPSFNTCSAFKPPGASSQETWSVGREKELSLVKFSEARIAAAKVNPARRTTAIRIWNGLSIASAQEKEESTHGHRARRGPTGKLPAWPRPPALPICSHSILLIQEEIYAAHTSRYTLSHSPGCGCCCFPPHRYEGTYRLILFSGSHAPGELAVTVPAMRQKTPRNHPIFVGISRCSVVFLHKVNRM